MLKFSIITPSFNQGVYICKCLASVRNQFGFFGVEQIILDNCSTDSTHNELEKYKANSRSIEVDIYIESDAGQTSAINKGFSLASGDIVSWLNTDEWFEDGALARVASYFESHPDIDVVFGNCNFVDANGNLLKEKREYFYSESMLIFYGCFIPSCATFIRRHVIDAGILLNPEFKVTMDFDWYVRIAKAGYKFAFLPETLASFTWHATNISSVFVERRKIERRLVQDRFSGVPGPRWLRTLVYGLMRWFWLSIRVTRRWVG